MAQKRNSLLLLDAINSNRVNAGQRRIRYVTNALFDFAQKEADRILEAEKLSKPSFQSHDKTVVISSLVTGDVTVKEALFDINNSNQI